jgi:hypothetical protein
MKKWLDIAFVCLSVIFIFLGISECKKEVREVQVKCSGLKDVQHFAPPASLKDFSYYHTTIIGKLLPQDTDTQTEGEVKEKDYNFLLMGTIQIGEKKGAVFYLKKERKCQPYKLGDEIDGWKIADIQKGKVILEMEDKKEEIKITDEKVSCTRTRITPLGTTQGQRAKAVVLSGPKETKTIKATSSSPSSTPKGSLKTPTQPLKRLKNQPQTRQKHTHPTTQLPSKNPFVEMLKRKGTYPGTTRRQGENPFLRFLKKH